MSHPICADAIDGDNKVTWYEVDLRGFAARRDLPTNTEVSEFKVETDSLHVWLTDVFPITQTDAAGDQQN